MAKRKKDNKNIETTTVDGNVNIFVKSGKRIISRKTIHNIGTLNLFYGLLLAMSEFSNNNYLPRYIQAGTGTTSSDPTVLNDLITPMGTSRSSLTQNVGGITKSNGKAFTTYQGIISYDGGADITITELGLFGTAETNTLVARVQLDGADELILKSGQDIVVQWTFSLQNIAQDS